MRRAASTLLAAALAFGFAPVTKVSAQETAAGSPLVGPSAAPVAAPQHLVGEALAVEWHGSLWPAHVIAPVPGGRVAIHYDGFGDEWDEIVGPSRIGAMSELAARGDARLFVAWGGSYWPAASLGRTSDGLTRIHYVGWGSQYDESVDAGRLLRPSSEGRLFVEWQGSWWRASIVRGTADGRSLIHYDGWGPEYDETVDASRMKRLG
jgi:hypothetical protein